MTSAILKMNGIFKEHKRSHRENWIIKKCSDKKDWEIALTWYQMKQIELDMFKDTRVVQIFRGLLHIYFLPLCCKMIVKEMKNGGNYMEVIMIINRQMKIPMKIPMTGHQAETEAETEAETRIRMEIKDIM